ncbi:NADH:ubiquinone oxidoreductase intermediate-associated protein 30 [Crassisporium funariophilum]|nr:NADH:ubiquinone oxidoreductase intermediate-associated protein 30 [Crassisporium funariophilum]
MLMRGADGPVSAPRTLFAFNTREDINLIATGCDGDIGGLSTVNFDLDERPEINKSIGKAATGMFWGDMRTQVKAGMEGKIRGGYAGFRNKNRPTMLGNMLEDVSTHEYLALRLRVAGDPRTHNSYFVNIQTDGPVSTDLWQHRLYFRKQDNSWENIFIPFDNFIRTNSGEMSENQMIMFREKVRSVGISILGGNSGVEGKYELGIDSIGVVNEEDVVQPPTSKFPFPHLQFYPKI